MNSNVEHLREEPLLNLILLANERTMHRLESMIERNRMSEEVLRKILLGLLNEQKDFELLSR